MIKIGLKDIAWVWMQSVLGTPYIYGGNNQLQGFDCSGLAQEYLRIIGLDPAGDQSAQALFDHFCKGGHGCRIERHQLAFGDLLFFGSGNTGVSHIAIALSTTIMFEAGGGNETTKTAKDAEKIGAMVRFAQIGHRKNFLLAWRPSEFIF